MVYLLITYDAIRKNECCSFSKHVHLGARPVGEVCGPGVEAARVREGVAINQSLSNLAQVISVLAENSARAHGDFLNVA